MEPSDFRKIEELFNHAHGEGRTSLFEHECYELLASTGAEAAPVHHLFPIGTTPTKKDLAAFPSDLVVLKIVSPDITHKTEAKGVRIIANEIGAVEATFELMRRQVPEVYSRYLDSHSGDMPDVLDGLDEKNRESTLAKRLLGVLVCSFVESDASGFATELFVGIRATTEFGPIISAGLGGVEMEILAQQTQKGRAVAIAPTGMIDGKEFFELFRKTLSYQRLSGKMRGGGRLVADEILIECFQAWIDLANHFSENNDDATFHINDLEVNPFTVARNHLAPLDGVCSFTEATKSAEPRPVHKIGHLLRPTSVAVIGVSEKHYNMGRIILNNLFDAGFNRERAWVIRPGIDEIDNTPCVPSIKDLPQKVDLFVVALGAAQVPSVVTELIEHDKANAVILIPGGLGEKEGSEDLAEDLKKRIRDAHRTGEGGPVFLGGNSLGVISHPGKYDTMFIPDFKLPKSRDEKERRSCFISQSGAYIITNLSRMPWLDPAYALSIGNQIDLRASDYLNYIKDDPDIEVFAIYMEGFQPGDGLAFARRVRETVALGKDVIFYKAGRTSEGRSATAGHTASVAGDYAVCEAAIEQAGAFVATDFNEFSDLLKLATRFRNSRIRGNRLAAASNAGFESVGMADSIKQQESELSLVHFSPKTVEDLQKLLVDNRLDTLVDVKNPLDVTPMANDAAFCSMMASILKDDTVDALVAGIVPLTPAMRTLEPGSAHNESIFHPDSIAQMLPKIVAEQRKPVIAVIDSGELFDPLAKALDDGGLPVFRSADRAVRVLCRYINTKLRTESISSEDGK